MPVTHVRSKWASGNLVFHEATAGNGAAVHFGIDDDGLDVKLFGATSGAYLLWDESADKLIFDGADFGLNDADLLTFGDASDITMTWSGTAFNIAQATVNSAINLGVDGAGIDLKLFGDTASAYMLWDQSADALLLGGDARLDLSSATVAAANTDGGVIKAGTSGAPVTEDTADMKFMSLYFDDGATSGDARGMYLRLYITGAGGGGEAARVFTTISDVAAATAHGQHTSLNFGTSGTVTGQGIASRNTLHMPATALVSNVTMSAVQAEIWNDAATSDPGGSTLLSYFRAVNGGDATGAADVDDDAVLLEVIGTTAGAAKMWTTGLTAATVNAATTCSLKIRVGATVYYIPVATAIA